jgi:hypothetical protein
MKNNTAIFNVCSINHLAYARSLFESVYSLHSDVDCYSILVDEIDPDERFDADRFHIVEAKSIEIPDFPFLCFKYDIQELNGAVKPFGFKYLFKKGYDKILYFDSDICVYNKLDNLINKLDDHSCLLTAHINSPMRMDDNLFLSEEHFLQCGTYNVGFIAFSNTMDSKLLLDWWSEKCHKTAFNETETGLFVEQKWLNLFPAFSDKIYTVRDPGCNMAYWNLHERFLQGRMVNGKHPLVFFHFSGFDMENLDIISRYQNRFHLEEREDLRELFVEYKNKLIGNGFFNFIKYEYKYKRYSNGEAIGKLARRMYPSVRERFPEPFVVTKGSYYQYLKMLGLLETVNDGIAFIDDKKKQKSMYETLIRGLIKIIGIDRYAYLIENIRYISTPRRQDFLVRRKSTPKS